MRWKVNRHTHTHNNVFDCVLFCLYSPSFSMQWLTIWSLLGLSLTPCPKGTQSSWLEMSFIFSAVHFQSCDCKHCRPIYAVIGHCVPHRRLRYCLKTKLDERNSFYSRMKPSFVWCLLFCKLPLSFWFPPVRNSWCAWLRWPIGSCFLRASASCKQVMTMRRNIVTGVLISGVPRFMLFSYCSYRVIILLKCVFSPFATHQSFDGGYFKMF